MCYACHEQSITTENETINIEKVFEGMNIIKYLKNTCEGVLLIFEKDEYYETFICCCEQKVTNNEQKSYEPQANITNNGDSLEHETRVNISEI